MLPFLHLVASWNLKRRIYQIENFIKNPHQVQEATLLRLIKAASLTQWGKKHRYDTLTSLTDFQRCVPISTYEDLYPYIQQMLEGEEDILWPGSVSWFAKSSGTTNDVSKYIPITEASLYDCHYNAGKDLIAMYLHYHNPNSRLFDGKVLSIGGSHEAAIQGKSTRYGDLSAVLLENLPMFFELIRTPSKKVALLSDWEVKLLAMCKEVMNEDVRAIVGVPTWTMLLMHKILEEKGISDKNLSRVWPNLEVFFHGGVNFTPYKSAFQQLFQHKIQFVNIYNASEGFLGIQMLPEDEGMLLMLDYGVYYEFIPMSVFGTENQYAIPLSEVETNQNYAILISTNGGLWRYLIGDTVTFTDLHPYKIKITGRTKHFINAFGEELVVENAEQAIAAACEQTDAEVKEYTAAPVYISQQAEAGAHEWLIEFSKNPKDLNEFGKILDRKLRTLNSDYDAKRKGDLIIREPVIIMAHQGLFYEWMKKRGKLGGQNKVPRLSNNREYIESIKGLMLQTD